MNPDAEKLLNDYQEAVQRQNFWGWLAGMVDSDGCLHIRINDQHDRINYDPEFIVTNTNLAALEHIKAMTGLGTITKSTPKTKNSRTCYYFKIRGTKVKEVLYKLRSKLVIKRQQADALLEFPAAKQGTPVPTDTQTKRRELYYRVRSLNVTGRYK